MITSVWINEVTFADIFLISSSISDFILLELAVYDKK